MEDRRTEDEDFLMGISRKFLSAAGTGLLAAALAACSTSGDVGGPSGGMGRPAATGVEGSWIDAKGTGLSTFATDTGQKLADGSYTMTGPTSVEIHGTSLIRQTPVSFNCLLVSTSQLNCTSGTGQNFVLTRRT